MRSLLIVPFTLQLVGAVGLMGYLSFRNEQAAIERQVDQLTIEVSDRVSQKLQTYVETPARLNRINADAVQLEELNPKDLDRFSRHFLAQLKQNNVSSIQFGNPQGDFRVVRVVDGEFQLVESDRNNPAKFAIYSVDGEGQKDKLLNTISLQEKNTGDRLWPNAATALACPVQTSVLLLSPAADISLCSSYPIFDRANKPAGVFAVTLKFDGISEFLSQLKVSQSGQVFILDRAGNLVANSLQEAPVRSPPESIAKLSTPLNLSNSSNPIARELGQELKNHLGELSRSNQAQRLNLVSDRKNYLAEVVPFRDRAGLDWLIVTVLPRADFTAPLHRNAQIAVGLCLLALFGSLVLGNLIAAQIIRPLRQLSQAAQAIGDGNLKQETDLTTGIRELQRLSDGFNQMVQQLRRSFQHIQTALTETDEKYTTILRNSHDSIFIITLDDRRWLEANVSFLDQSGYTREELLDQSPQAIKPFTNLSNIFRQVQLGAVQNQELNWQN